MSQIEEDRPTTDPQPVLLHRWWEAVGDEETQHTRLEVTVSGVIARQPLCEKALDYGGPSTRRPSEPADAPTKLVETEDAPAKPVVEDPCQCALRHAGGEVDERAFRAGDRDAAVDPEVPAEQRR